MQNQNKQTEAPTAADPSKAVNSEGDQLAVSKKAQAVIEQAAATADTGDATGAASTLTQAAEATTDTDDKVAYYAQAISIQVNAGSYDSAVASAQAAIQADPNNYLLYANLGYVYEAAGNNAEAISSFQKAIEVFDANPDSEATNTNGGKAGIQAEIERLQQA